MFDAKKAGEYLTRRRRLRGLTQAQLAACLSVSRQAVSKWERGEAMPDISILGLLSEALDITAEELIGAASGAGNEAETGGPAMTPPGGAAGFEERLTAMLDELKERLDDLYDCIDGLENRIGEHEAALEELYGRLGEPENRDRGQAYTKEELDTIVEGELAKDSEAGWDRIVSLGQQLSGETLFMLAERLMRKTGRLEISHLRQLAPYLSRDILDRIAGGWVFSDDTLNALVGFSKYFSVPALERLLLRYIEEPHVNWGIISHMARYLPKASVEALVGVWEQRNGAAGWDCIRYIVNGVSKDTLTRLVEAQLAESAPDPILAETLKHVLPKDMHDALSG